MSTDRAIRVGQNEALYRQVNERIEELNEAFGTITRRFTIACECGELACAEQISVARDVYDRTRAESTHFIAKPGHEKPDVERVIAQGDDYVVIEKKPGLPAEHAEETDPLGGAG